MNLQQRIKDSVRDIPDFPKPGILFKDITPVLQNAALFSKIIEAFAVRYTDKNVDVIAGIESRGFIFGSALAVRMGKPFVLVRKEGKLPYETVKASYDLEYGSATIEMHIDAIRKGNRVVVIDDLLATGGTANATCRLIENQGGVVVESAFVIELGFLNGRNLLNREVFSLVQY